MEKGAIDGTVRFWQTVERSLLEYMEKSNTLKAPKLVQEWLEEPGPGTAASMAPASLSATSNEPAIAAVGMAAEAAEKIALNLRRRSVYARFAERLPPWTTIMLIASTTLFLANCFYLNRLYQANRQLERLTGPPKFYHSHPPVTGEPQTGALPDWWFDSIGLSAKGESQSFMGDFDSALKQYYARLYGGQSSSSDDKSATESFQTILADLRQDVDQSDQLFRQAVDQMMKHRPAVEN